MTNTKRYDFGVTIDLLSDMPARSIRARVSDVRNQATQLHYALLDTVAEQVYNRAMELFITGRYHFEPKYSTERYNLLRKASGLLVLTYRYDKVKWEVTTALSGGTPVCVFSPYKTPDMVKLNSVAQWEQLCEREANPDWAKWSDELSINEKFIMNTDAPWLEMSLNDMAARYSTTAAFIEYLNAEIHRIEEQGEWDVDTTSSVVYNEKASVAHYVANKGMDKGKRTCSSQYKYGKKQYWYNYEVLLVDIVTKYLHMTYLESINYKPMVRIVSDGVDYGRLVYTEFAEDSDSEIGLSLTPLYEDPYFTHEGEAEE
jgi:hypothetical protein